LSCSVSQTPSADAVIDDAEAVYLMDINIDSVLVMNELNRLRLVTAAGPDELSTQVLRLVLEEICEPLIIILQPFIDKGSILDDWRRTNISSFYRQGGKVQAANYRPLGLTSQISKLRVDWERRF